MNRIFALSAFITMVLAAPQPSQWRLQPSGTDANLRGLSAVSAKVAWASGTKGTVLRTVDAGEHWQNVSVTEAHALDFRDVQAFDSNTAFALAAGPGEQSRIYKTADGGQHWRMQFINKEPKAFFDCFAFWDRTHGIAVSDSVDGQFRLLATGDGETWGLVQPKSIPAALPEEGAFAASGTCLATFGDQDVWFVSGGPAARVFHSPDRGQTWTAVSSPIRSGAASQGIFSVVFWSKSDGAIVGGDYKNPKNAQSVAAFTTDGGKTWQPSPKGPDGYRSAVAARPSSQSGNLFAVGISGASRSRDGGRNWIPEVIGDNPEYNSVSFGSPATGWAVGPQGRIARFDASRAGRTLH
jgi:photosystem II stability/assembly factor-like uncharacterized protein